MTARCLECPREEKNGCKSGLPLTAFQHADVVPLHFSGEAKLFLRQICLLAKPAKDTPEGASNVQILSNYSWTNLNDLLSFCPPTMVGI